MAKFYITTTLPYVNADPHIGFALEIIQADAVARWRARAGDEVFFNTGTDEHGLKIYRKAQEAGKDPQHYVDEYASRFERLKEALDLSYNAFIRTTDPHHVAAAQEFWQRCAAAGDIYKKNYQVKYCVGCELEKTESELVDGRCPLHPDVELESIEEENYFFRFSRFQKPLLALYRERPDFVLPSWRLNEIRSFVEQGLEDFSISRLAAKMPWGIPVPDDSEHVMYVWFDALINYISTLNWPEGRQFTDFWPGMQTAGKDNLRQQSAMWQSMLLSAGLPASKQILIHGFITSGGQKMSKSLGNVVNPFDLVEKYGTDALRYYLLAEIPPFEDGDFTIEKFEQRYNGDLANGLGNLVSRVATLLERSESNLGIQPGNTRELAEKVEQAMQEFKFNDALAVLWQALRQADETMAREKPWEKKADEQLAILKPVAQLIIDVADLLRPFLPKTAETILTQFTGARIQKGTSLFPRV